MEIFQTETEKRWQPGRRWESNSVNSAGHVLKKRKDPSCSPKTLHFSLIITIQVSLDVKHTIKVLYTVRMDEQMKQFSEKPNYPNAFFTPLCSYSEELILQLFHNDRMKSKNLQARQQTGIAAFSFIRSTAETSINNHIRHSSFRFLTLTDLI